MFSVTAETEREILIALKKEPLAVRELRPEGLPIVFGAPDPFALEEIRRAVERMSHEGLCEMRIENYKSITDAREIHRTTGRWQLTQKGRDHLVRLAKKELGYKDVD
jgi:hypothetical protein